MADKLLKSIKFPTLPDRYVIGDSTLTEEGAAADAKAVGEALATKADTNGRYEDLIAGGAEQLMADEYETDKEPYLFRPTGGSADVGNREYLDKIVGGTVAWNQQAPNTELTGVGSRPSVSGARIVKGHKYLFGAYLDVDEELSTNAYISPHGFDDEGNVNTFCLLSWRSKGDIYKIGESNVRGVSNGTGLNVDGNFWFYMNAQTGSFKNLKLFDLTAMFGSTIADYIYSLEQAHAGDGVAWFKKLFPKPYYAYNAGELMSVQAVSHDMVGFNAWDEEWEVGGISNTTGNNATNNQAIRSKNYIPVIGGATYFFRCDASMNTYNVQSRFYDANKNYLGTGGTWYCNTAFTIPTNARYMRFGMQNQYGTTYHNDICINISDPTRNGEYEPYTKHTYPLDSSLTLRGIPKLVDGKLAFDGDIYQPSGEVQRRYGVVDLGTLNWVSDSTNRFYAVLPAFAKPSGSYNVKANLLCAKYDNLTQNQVYANNKGIAAQATNGNTVYVYDTAYSTPSEIATGLSGVYLIYELATPTTETADGYEQYQICDPSGTEEFVTDSIVPVGHETRYPHDLKKKIETAPDSPSTDGTYLMKRSGGKNTYMALPSTPSANGAYVLTVTVSGGTASYSWTAKG